MKKVCYIHQYFKTPEEGGAIRSYFIAQALIEQGIEVEMITSHNKPSYEFKAVDGINVHYLPVAYSNHYSFKIRILSFVKFVFLAIKKTRKIDRPFLVYASSTPLSVGIIALWLRWFRKIPYIFEVRDLWPEAPIQLKIIKSKFLIFHLRQFEKLIYNDANEIIALSPGMKEGIMVRTPSASVHVVPNMADLDFFSSDQHPKSSGFTIGYFGALGLTNNMDFIIEIAKSSAASGLKVNFLIAGEGSHKEMLINKASQLENMTVLPFNNRNDIKNLMENVDACLTSFADFPILATNSPNKFFDGLAAGKLCIVNTGGWLKDLVEENKCGLFLATDNAKEFPELIKPFLENADLLAKYQKNARKLALAKFSKAELTSRVCEIIQKSAKY